MLWIASSNRCAPPAAPLPVVLWAAGNAYWPLDPLTLEKANDAVPLTIGHDWPNMAVSADGSTFVVINSTQGPLEDWIIVHDRVGGPQCVAITPEEAVFNPRLSTDGSRLIVEPGLMCGPSGCGERVWYTYDAHSGDLVSTTRVEVGDPVWPDLIDPAGERLYYPFHERPPLSSSTPAPASLSVEGPWPLQIAAYDLATGQEVARTAIPDVLAGSWQGESIDQAYVGEMEQPAIALSPDGSRIAVIDAAIEALTLIDTETLAVVETLPITRPESTWHNALVWLGIAPQTAQAKVSEGRTISATFSADGQHLYLTGYEMEIGDTIEDIDGHGLGLMRIDVNSGEITAEALAGHAAEIVIPSPDGQSVYVQRSEEPWWDNDSPNYVLQRLDAETLESLAERSFAIWPQLMLVPAGPEPG